MVIKLPFFSPGSPLLGPSGGGSTVPPTNVGVAQGTWSLYADCYADSQTQLDVEVAVRSRESQKTRFPQQGLNGADRLRHFDFHSSSDLVSGIVHDDQWFIWPSMIDTSPLAGDKPLVSSGKFISDNFPHKNTRNRQCVMPRNHCFWASSRQIAVAVTTRPCSYCGAFTTFNRLSALRNEDDCETFPAAPSPLRCLARTQTQRAKVFRQINSENCRYLILK